MSVTHETWTITREERETIVAQIGRGNVLAISGGRIKALPDGIELPVSHGYKVRVHLTPGVRRGTSSIEERGEGPR